MSAPSATDVARLRRRLMIMIGFDAVCVLVAAGAIVGDLTFHIAWLGRVFAAALIAGFAAQFWLAAGLARRR